MRLDLNIDRISLAAGLISGLMNRLNFCPSNWQQFTAAACAEPWRLQLWSIICRRPGFLRHLVQSSGHAGRE